MKLNPPSLRVVSNVTGDWLTAEQATDPHYWATHLSRLVRFGDGVARLWQEPGAALLEVGPGQALGAWALQHPSSEGSGDRLVLSSLRHSYDRQHDLAFLLGALGRLWLAGVQVNWPELHRGGRRRVPLPSYPFERKRYWIEPRQLDPFAAPRPERPATLTKKQDLAEWFYLPAWKQAPPADAFAAGDADAQARRHLVFLDSCGIGERLAARLEAEGHTVLTVRAGDEFQQLGGGAYAVSPGRAEDYEALVGALRSSEQMPQVIHHLWGVTPEEGPEPDAETLDAQQAAGFYSLLFLAQALGGRSGGGPLRLVVVTSGVQSVSGGERLSPAKATALGPCRVIPLEYPHISCQVIDVVAPEVGGAQADVLAGQLLAELAAATEETLVAYRGQRRWIQDYDPVRLQGGGEDAPAAGSLLKEGGVYLITGGMGGIGLTLAEHLARTARARLVLTGRSPLPAREEWEGWLATHDEGDAAARTIRRLKSFEESGAEVLTVCADVTSREQMERVVGAARERFGRIDGVVHAAGVLPGGMIQMKTQEVAGAVLAPKVHGTYVLDAVLADSPPDFVAFCSSLNAIFGGFGLVDHCGANAFLDAYAEAAAARGGTHVFSINWDGWLEVGQAANAALSAGLQGIRSASRHEEEEKEEKEEREEGAHPLLYRVLQDEPERLVYSARLSTAEHWVVNEHRLVGKGVVPGTGYLEMVRAAFEARAGGETVVLEKVIFMAPLVVEDGQVRDVRVTFTKNKGAYDFSVTSRVGEDASSASAWQEHARGRVRTAPVAPPPDHALGETLARLNPRPFDSSETRRRGRGAASEESHFSEADRTFGPRWENLLKSVGLVGDEAVALLELPEEFAADVSQYKLHPSLLDAAVGYTQIFGEGFYLPLAYESIKVHRPLAPRVYSHAKYREDGSASGDVLVCDLLLLDEQGRALVEIKEYTLRRIYSTAAIDGAPVIDGGKPGVGAATPAVEGEMKSGTEPAGAKPEAKSESLVTEGINPREGAEVFGRILRSRLRGPRIAVASRDLHGMIEQTRALTGSRILEQLNQLQSSQQKHPRPNLAVAYVAPRNEMEQRLAEIWQDVLGINEIGVHDNFFESGGDSLLATLLVGRLGDAFNVDLSLRAMFDAPTVAEMGVAIVQKQAQRVDAGMLADMLAKIKDASKEELQAMIEAERQSIG